MWFSNRTNVLLENHSRLTTTSPVDVVRKITRIRVRPPGMELLRHRPCSFIIKINDCVIDWTDKTMFSINVKRIQGRQFGEGFSREGLRRKSSWTVSLNRQQFCTVYRINSTRLWPRNNIWDQLRLQFIILNFNTLIVGTRVSRLFKKKRKRIKQVFRMCDSGDGEKNLMFNCDKRNRKVSAGADAEREKGKKKKKKETWIARL